MLLQGCQKGYLYAVYALIYEVTVQDDAWDKKDVEPEEMWFGVFFYQNKSLVDIQKHIFILKGKERVITFESSKIWDDTKIIENIYEKN